LLPARSSTVRYLAFSWVMTCLVLATLFVAALTKLHLGKFLVIAFILAMLLLIASLVLFLVEVRVSRRAIRVRDELLR
jgi:hypothetical protein